MQVAGNYFLPRRSFLLTVRLKLLFLTAFALIRRHDFLAAMPEPAKGSAFAGFLLFELCGSERLLAV